MSTKTLQIRLDDDEYDALAALADAEGIPLSDFCRRTLRLGVAAEHLQALQFQETARRAIDREVAKKVHTLVTQCTLILHELAEKNGLRLDEIKADAAETTQEHFTDGDALEAALVAAQAASAQPNGAQDE